MALEEPQRVTVFPHDQLESELAGMVRRSRRVLWMVVFTQGIVLLLAIAAIILLAVNLASARHRIAADEAALRAAECGSHYTIATAALPPTATKLGVQFVEASRKAFVVLHCPGHLGKPVPELQQLGRKYGIPIGY